MESKKMTLKFIYRVAMKKQTENRLMDMGRWEERVRCMERVTWKLKKKKNTCRFLYA